MTKVAEAARKGAARKAAHDTAITKTPGTEARGKAIAAALGASEKKAEDIVVMQVGDLVLYTEYFVICSASNSQQMKAIADSIEETLHKRRIRPRTVEGRNSKEWTLMDFGDFVVHVFEKDARAYYSLEKLWMDAPRVEFDTDENKAALAGQD